MARGASPRETACVRGVKLPTHVYAPLITVGRRRPTATTRTATRRRTITAVSIAVAFIGGFHVARVPFHNV